jgi:hypothetical protein
MLKRAGSLMTLALTLATCQDKLLYYVHLFGSNFSWLWLGPGPH